MAWSEERQKIVSRILDRMDRKGSLRGDIVEGAKAKGALSTDAASDMVSRFKANKKPSGGGADKG
jgi:hypothetical protein